MDHLSTSDGVFVHPTMGLMVVDPEDRYALPVFGVVEMLVEGQTNPVLAWEGDAPTREEAKQLKEYE